MMSRIERGEVLSLLSKNRRIAARRARQHARLAVECARNLETHAADYNHDESISRAKQAAQLAEAQARL